MINYPPFFYNGNQKAKILYYTLSLGMGDLNYGPIKRVPNNK